MHAATSGGLCELAHQVALCSPLAHLRQDIRRFCRQAVGRSRLVALTSHRLLERLTLAESTYGKEHLVTATCLNDVGTFAQMFRDFDRAEALFEHGRREIGWFRLAELQQASTSLDANPVESASRLYRFPL